MLIESELNHLLGDEDTDDDDNAKPIREDFVTIEEEDECGFVKTVYPVVDEDDNDV